jgi:hypothetical protein
MMGRKGDALWLSRPVNFSVVFPDTQAAKQFAVQLKQDEYRCEVALMTVRKTCRRRQKSRWS